MNEMNLSAARRMMVDCQIRPTKVTDERVLEAFATVPRELFVGKSQRGIAYADEDLPLPGGRWLLEPMVLARLVQALDVGMSDHVLIVGGATGYGTAILAQLAGSVISIETDLGITGVGEVCPLGPFYLPAYGPGVRTGIAELAPHLIGQDATAIQRINEIMDRALLGHPYVKSPIDMACWDILGQETGKSVCDLLGGRDGETVSLYRAITQLPAKEMAANVEKYRDEGYTKFQLKVGGNADDDDGRYYG